MTTNIKGAIFDIDGTLLDSMHVWENVAGEYLISKGLTPKPDLNEELLLRGGHEIPRYFQDEYGLHESIDEIRLGIYDLLKGFYLNEAAPKAGALRTLSVFHSRGVKLCAATATDRWLIEPALRRCGLLDFFERIFICSEERTSKSSPDIYIRAAAFLRTAIEDTLVFEDALYAMKSAKSAGFPVAAVYDKSADDKQNEIKELCDYYYKSLADLKLP